MRLVKVISKSNCVAFVLRNLVSFQRRYAVDAAGGGGGALIPEIECSE